MTSYGFKLFKLELVKRDGRTAQPWTYEGPKKTEKLVLDDLEALIRKHIAKPERGLPLGADARPLSAAERKARPVFQIEDVDRVGTHALFLKLRYGRHRDEDLGLPASELATTTQVDLTEIAPTRSYRIGILAPSSGKTGMMVVEAIAGACPSKYFMKWMRRWAVDAATKADKVDESWQKLTAHAAMDPVLLRRYVNQANADSVVLVQRSTGSSRLRRDERFRVEAAVFSNQSRKVMELAETAIVSDNTEEQTDAEYAKELAELLGKDDLSDLDFDDGWVVVDTASGKQQISPSRVPEIFVYPIDNRQPTDRNFRVETKKEVVRVRRTVGATLDLSGW
ncbi:hypothetical protein HQ308_14735 [Rhodococcus sp. BP-241]|uniref:hypothetical protein n=1 Tax=Rhodococcus sp. BP-241 TaxID=2739441 RepID=UPI001C9B220B|nr:hypothetical protein [Rhodococcus sp. BP-241]MBY6708059.1 hypothetical protein [Rhodococcus sp. BP-241]